MRGFIQCIDTLTRRRLDIDIPATLGTDDVHTGTKASSGVITRRSTSIVLTP
jgi:hypothetical protein